MWILVDAVILANVGIAGLVAGHIDKDPVDRIQVDHFFHDIEKLFLLIGGIDGYGVKILIGDVLPFRGNIEPVRMLFEDALVCSAKVKPDDDFDTVCVAFGNHIPQHIVLHIGIGVILLHLGGIKSHNAAGVNDQGIGSS